MFLKLAAEVFGVEVAALFSDLVYWVPRAFQFIFCQKKPVLDDVVHAGDAKSFPANFLQMPGTDMQLFCHFGNAPGGRWVVFDIHVQLQQLQFPEVIGIA